MNSRQLGLWLWRRWKGYRKQAVLNTLVGMLLVVASLSFVWLTKLAIDVATRETEGVSLETALGGLVLVIAVQLALGFSSRWIRAILGVKAQNHMQAELFERLLSCKWKDLKRFHSGNLLNRMERDVSDVVVFLTENVPTFATAVMQFAGAFLFLFFMDRMLACIVVLIVPFFILSSKLYVKKMRRLTHEVRDSESRIQAVLQESLQHVMVIKTLGRCFETVEKLSGLQGTLRGRVVSKTKYSSVSSLLMNLGFSAGYMTAFSWGVISLEKGAITYGALIAFVQLVGQIQGPLRTLTRFVPVFITAFTAGERLMELEEIPVETSGEEKRMTGQVGITISQLVFAYSPESRRIFDRFSCSFPPASITAIVGETGCGKTSLIRLLLALAAPAEGTISLFDGTRELPVSPETRGNFSYVPQGNTLLSGTIRGNLLLGNPSASEDDMWHALHVAAADFVKKLPEGLDAPCGEMGDGLSEGQAQRISIARSLLKKAPVLLLDEATSSLDAETEKLVIRNIVGAGAGQTLIFVTHRPEVLKYCTQILRLEKTPSKREPQQPA